MTDPLGSFGPGGLGNEAHLGGLHGSLFPSAGGAAPELLSSDDDVAQEAAPIGRPARRRPWVLGLLRVGCTLAGCYIGGHYALPFMAWLGRPVGDPNAAILIGAGIGGVLGFLAPALAPMFLTPVLFLAGLGIVYWLVFGNPFVP